jgi:hypothetical protein
MFLKEIGSVLELHYYSEDCRITLLIESLARIALSFPSNVAGATSPDNNHSPPPKSSQLRSLRRSFGLF